TIIDEPDADPTLYGTRVRGTNDTGQLSGQYVDSSGAFHAFIATPNGNSFTYTPITVKRNDTFGFLLNEKGAMFGSYDEKHSGIENSWIRQPNGKLEIVALPEGPGGTIIQGLNNKGVATGNYFDANGAFRGFLRDKQGHVTDFDDPLAGSGENQGTNPIGINDSGEISGIVFDSNDVAHGFIRHAGDGSFVEYDVPDAGSAPGQGTLGLEIENDGWITGAYVDANNVSHGFLRDPDGNILAPIDPPDMGTNPFQGVVGVEHLEKGWAVGEYIDQDDVLHGFLCKKCETAERKIVEFDAPGAVDTFNVLSSNRQHQIVGSFHDENGIRHGFIRNP
ncbi:MAG: hypothetical protein JOY77_02440, partial [Alphaproteobacteria bacterium]|nr:hypothetical protein [Alphaproteobacteria bacterium]